MAKPYEEEVKKSERFKRFYTNVCANIQGKYKALEFKRASHMDFTMKGNVEFKDGDTTEIQIYGAIGPGAKDIFYVAIQKGYRTAVLERKSFGSIFETHNADSAAMIVAGWIKETLKRYLA